MKDLIVRWSDGTSEHWEVSDDAYLIAKDAGVELYEDGSGWAKSVFRSTKSVNIIDQEEDGICLECPECVAVAGDSVEDDLTPDQEDDIQSALELDLSPAISSPPIGEDWGDTDVLVSVYLPDGSVSKFPIEDLHGFVRGFEAGSFTA